MIRFGDLERRDLSREHAIYTGVLPPALRFEAAQFEALWALHPSDYHEIKIHGRTVKTPRWQQAYGKDYAYTGRINRALPVPPLLDPLLLWAKECFDPRLNALLLNWYDAKFAHYIGKHRDNAADMIEGSPIVTISCGAPRVFRVRPWRGTSFVDFETSDGSVLVMPYATNLAFTHEVPHHASSSGRRISVTIRAFR